MPTVAKSSCLSTYLERLRAAFSARTYKCACEQAYAVHCCMLLLRACCNAECGKGPKHVSHISLNKACKTVRYELNCRHLHHTTCSDVQVVTTDVEPMVELRQDMFDTIGANECCTGAIYSKPSFKTQALANSASHEV